MKLLLRNLFLLLTLTKVGVFARISTFVIIEETLEDRVRLMIKELDTLDRTYFGKDRTKQMKTALEAATTLLDTKPIDMSKSILET